MDIQYCDTCRSKIPEADLFNGGAYRDGTRIFCRKCSGDKAAPRPKRGTSGAAASAGPASAPPPRPPLRSERSRAAKDNWEQASAPKASNPGLYVGLAAAILMLLAVLAIVMLQKSGTPRTTPVEPPAITPTPVAPAPIQTSDAPAPVAPIAPNVPNVPPADPKNDSAQPRDEHAQRLLADARKFFQDNPKDLRGYQQRLKELASGYKGSPAAAEADKIQLELKPIFDTIPATGIDALKFAQPPASSAEQWKNAVNLLTLIDLKQDAVNGFWTVLPTETRSDGSTPAKIGIPYQPPEEYDLRVKFARDSGEESMILFLAKGKTPFDFFTAGYGNKHFGVDMVNGKRYFEPSQPAWVRVQEALANRRTYTLLLEVRNGGVIAFIDGRLLCQLKTDYTNLSVLPDAHPLHPDCPLGIGSWQNTVIFYSVELLEITGKGQKTH